MGTTLAPLLLFVSPPPFFGSTLRRRSRVTPSCCDRHVSTTVPVVSTAVAPVQKEAKKAKKAKRKTWVQRYEQLHEYSLLHGDVNVCRKVDASLYEWVVRQRYKWNSGDLSLEKYRLLSLLDFSWDGQLEKWKRMFYRATEYQAMHGHCNVRASEDLQLNQWLILQRYLYKRKQLSDERMRRLRGINLVLDPLEEKFMQQLATLKKFREKYGHGMIPRSVAPWADSLRRRWKDGNLSVRMYREFRSNGFCFSPQEYKVWIWLERLNEFKKSHGHCYPSFLHDRPLYEWIQAQRRKYRNGALNENVRAQLVELGLDLRPFRTVMEEAIRDIEEDFHRRTSTSSSSSGQGEMSEDDIYEICDDGDDDEGKNRNRERRKARLEEWKCLLVEMGRKKVSRKDVARLEKVGFDFHTETRV